MDTENFSDEILNMFVDGELADEESEAIHAQLLNDAILRERVCQIRAVRELVGYAYHNVPVLNPDRRRQDAGISKYFSMIAAVFVLFFAVLAGWYGHDYKTHLISAESVRADEVFDYLSKNTQLQHGSRKIVVHVTTGDIHALRNVLDETQRLISSYKNAGESLNIDVVTYKSGINLLRKGVTPFSKRIAKMSQNSQIRFYACARSIQKAEDKEGQNIVMLPQVRTDKMAREIIPERIADGWVYIKV